MAAAHQRQLILVVEGTAALGQSWNLLRSEYIDKIVRSFHVADSLSQKNSGLQGEMALVVFYSHGSHNGCLIQQTGWTTSLELFWRWLSSINFAGGGFGEAAIAEGLAEALLMCCPSPVSTAISQVAERQKHCVLVAASNPHCLPTPIPRPPVNTLMQSSTTGDSLAEHWWLADADTVAKAFPQCLVSLSVISPRQLPLLRTIYNGGRKSVRATDSPLDSPKYPHHMVLLSESFLEARGMLSRTGVASSTVSSVTIPKIEPISLAATSIAGQTPAVNSRATIGAPGIVTGRQGASNGVIPTVAVKTEVTSAPAVASASGLPHVVSTSLLQNASPVPLNVSHPASVGLSSQEGLQSSVISDTTVVQEFKPLVNTASSLRAIGVSTGNAGLLSNSSQARPILSTSALPGASSLGISAVTGSGVGLPMPSLLPSSIGAGSACTNQNSLGVTQSGLGLTNNPVGLGVGLGMGQGVGLGGFGNSGNNLGPVPSVTSSNTGMGNVQVVGLGQSVTGLGQGGLAGGNQIGPNGLVMGHNVLPGLVPGTVNTGGGTMIPTPGLSQPVQGLQSLSVINNNVPNAHQVPTTVATPPQPQTGTAPKYSKIWEGMLTGSRQGKPVFICRLEGYKLASSPDTLAADWPNAMQIVRLIAQDYMNSKNYQGKSEVLIFRTMGEHGFLDQLAEKKLCAVIQLPSQTLLLASTERRERMIGMLFPGDMVVFKPQPSSQQQQAQNASSGIVQTFSQGQLPGQARPQLMQSGQLSGQGPASLSGNGFLP